MKKLVVLLVSSVVYFSDASGQKMPEDYFQEARADMRKNKKVALDGFTYLVEHYPKSRLCSSAYYNMGQIYADMGNVKMAIESYKVAIFNKGGSQPEKSLRIGAYHERVSAALKLVDVYEKMGEYDSALRYLYLYDTGFRKINSCGTAAELDKDHTVARYGEINLKAKRIKDAEKALLSMLQFKWHKYDGEVNKQLTEIFRKYEDPKKLKAEIQATIENYYWDSSFYVYNENQYKTTYCCINFIGVKVRYNYSLDDDWWNDGFDRSGPLVGLSERELIIANLKRSELYVLVQEL